MVSLTALKSKNISLKDMKSLKVSNISNISPSNSSFLSLKIKYYHTVTIALANSIFNLISNKKQTGFNNNVHWQFTKKSHQ